MHTQLRLHLSEAFRMDFYKTAGVVPVGDQPRTHFSNQITQELDGKEVIVMGWTHI
ncbi:MAG: hypothetical protein ACFFEV_03810, partial [Candidatus Thorarchaeota archaeon]